MAKKCIFCGEEFGTFSGKKLTVGYDSEDVCPACFEKYCDLGEAELAEKILATGRARHSQTIREYLTEQRAKEEAAQEWARKREEKFMEMHPEMGKCPKCGSSMLRYGPIQIKLGEETFLFSDWNRLMSGALTVTLARCKECGYTEFYTPEENELV